MEPLTSPDRGPGPSPGRRSDPGALARQLGGDLPCVTCRYNLRGMSVRAVCPECGTAVRATILALVDPLAAELTPIPRPRRLAAGLLLWSFAGLLALVLGWALRAADAWGIQAGVRPATGWVPTAIAVLTWCSGLGALVLVRPHEGASRAGRLGAIVAILAYVPLGWLQRDGGLMVASAAWTSSDLLAGGTDRSLHRLGTGALLLVILAGLRPNARLLVARSLALRTGRVDRQTMLAMGAAVLVTMTGDLLALGSGVLGPGVREALQTTATALIVSGWGLLTLGLAGACADCLRIARAVVVPPPTLRQVLAAGRSGA